MNGNKGTVLNEENYYYEEARARALEFPGLSWIEYLPYFKPFGIILLVAGTILLITDALKNKRYLWVFLSIFSPFNMYYLFRFYSRSRSIPFAFIFSGVIALFASLLKPIFTKKLVQNEDNVTEEKTFTLDIPYLENSPFHVMQVTFKKPFTPGVMPEKLEPSDEDE